MKKQLTFAVVSKDEWSEQLSRSGRTTMYDGALDAVAGGRHVVLDYDNQLKAYQACAYIKKAASKRGVDVVAKTNGTRVFVGPKED